MQQPLLLTFVAAEPPTHPHPLPLPLHAPPDAQDIRRLMPGTDPVAFLVAQPGLVLDMEVCGQASTLEHN